jgi:WD40 repeat protein
MGAVDLVESVEFSHDGKMLVSGSFDGTVKLWNVKTGGLIRTFLAP